MFTSTSCRQALSSLSASDPSQQSEREREMAEKRRRVGWRKNKHVPLRQTLVLILTSTLQKTQTHDSATVMKVPQRTIDMFYQQPELSASVHLDCQCSYVSLTHTQTYSLTTAHAIIQQIRACGTHKKKNSCAQQVRVQLKHINAHEKNKPASQS